MKLKIQMKLILETEFLSMFWKFLVIITDFWSVTDNTFPSKSIKITVVLLTTSCDTVLPFSTTVSLCLYDRYVVTKSYKLQIFDVPLPPSPREHTFSMLPHGQLVPLAGYITQGQSNIEIRTRVTLGDVSLPPAPEKGQGWSK